MKLCHNIKASVFCKEDEDKEEMKQILTSLFPFDLEKEKIIIKEQKASGFNEKIIIIYEILLEKDRHINSFLESLNKNLSQEHKEMILNQISSRLNKGLDFYIRLDKEKLKNKELKITDEGNCIHLRLNIAAFPKKKEKAEEIIRKIFKLN